MALQWTAEQFLRLLTTAVNATIPDPEALVRRAEIRWAAIAAARSDLIPAIAVQRPMVIRTIRAVARLRLEPPAVHLTRQRVADKLEAE